MKKMAAVLLSVTMAAGTFSVCGVQAAQEEAAVPSGLQTQAALYVHAVTGAQDGEAWQMWQSAHDERFNEANTSEKYFFLPSSADGEKLEVYNAFGSSVTLGGVTIPAGETKTVPYSTDGSSTVTAQGRTYTLTYMRSSAEAAVYINQADADGNGTDLMTYLNADKSRSSAATGAIVTPDGTIDNTPVKKIKGRGNTSWDKPKKGYNITYDKKVSVAGMAKNKKYSILPNYQDDSLARNRILYDLSDAVGMPYASDSRFVDFYVNGYYWGVYQMAEKVEAGSLVTDVSGDEYLNEDGAVNAEFPFIAEVDASAGGDDYYVTCELYTGEQYYGLLRDCAAMNYTSGWLLNTGSWIASRNPMRRASFDFYTGAYTTGINARYSQTYSGMYNYACDWMLNRAAWLSNEMYADYTGSKVAHDVDRDGAFTVGDITLVQRYLAEFCDLTALQQELADANGAGVNISDVTSLQRIMADMEN